MAIEDDDPGLPILLDPCSNGEYFPAVLPAPAREARRRAIVASVGLSRRMGISRREFLLGVCGAATSLTFLDACTREADRAEGRRTGGRFDIPETSTTDPDVARRALAGEEFVLDVQGHLLDSTLDPRAREAARFGQGFPQARCGDADSRDCFSIEHFLEEVFLRSDTSMVVLSALPIAGDVNPLSPAVMEETRRVAKALCGDQRILMQGQAVPNAGQLAAAFASMEDVAQNHDIGSWKVYTHAGGRGWFLDDHDPGAPQIGEAFVRKAVELGTPTISVHKGLSGSDPFASPVDIGPAARRHPDVNFVVYHSGYEVGRPEGAFDPSSPGGGVDRLIASLLDAGIAPNRNVYAELGSTWFNLMRSPTDAAHVLGKLLKFVGEDRVLWGTDSIWYGSPQGQIQAFRAFQITEELQEAHDYPALTPEVKAKVLGENAARLYGVEPIRGKCEFTRAELERVRAEAPVGNQAWGPRTVAEVRAHVAAHRF